MQINWHWIFRNERLFQQCIIQAYSPKGVAKRANLSNFFMYGNGFLSRGFTDRREILYGGLATPRTGLLPFWGIPPGMAEFWASMVGYASCWSTCSIFLLFQEPFLGMGPLYRWEAPSWPGGFAVREDQHQNQDRWNCEASVWHKHNVSCQINIHTQWNTV